MLAANEAVAGFLCARGRARSTACTSRPSAASVRELLDELEELGVPTPPSRSARRRPRRQLAEAFGRRRRMARDERPRGARPPGPSHAPAALAQAGLLRPRNLGHFGLASPATCTSPRRSAATRTWSCTGPAARTSARAAASWARRSSPRRPRLFPRSSARSTSSSCAADDVALASCWSAGCSERGLGAGLRRRDRRSGRRRRCSCTSAACTRATCPSRRLGGERFVLSPHEHGAGRCRRTGRRYRLGDAIDGQGRARRPAARQGGPAPAGEPDERRGRRAAPAGRASRAAARRRRARSAGRGAPAQPAGRGAADRAPVAVVVRAMARETGIKRVASNRKAYHDYFIDETYEAGIALVGTEVKSLRDGRMNLRDSYVEVKGSASAELFLVGVHISPYEQGNIWNHEPLRRAQAAAAPARDRPHRASGAGARLHAGAHQALLQGRPRQGRDRPGARQEALRQAPRHGPARRQARCGACLARSRGRQPVGRRIGSPTRRRSMDDLTEEQIAAALERADDWSARGRGHRAHLPLQRLRPGGGLRRRGWPSSPRSAAPPRHRHPLQQGDAASRRRTTPGVSPSATSASPRWWTASPSEGPWPPYLASGARPAASSWETRGRRTHVGPGQRDSSRAGAELGLRRSASLVYAATAA